MSESYSRVKEITSNDAKNIDPDDVDYYTMNNGSVMVMKKPGEVTSTRLSTRPLDSDIVELTETDTKDRYVATFSHNDYRESRRSKTPGTRTSYAGVVEERRNYKFYASGTGTTPGTEEIKTNYRATNVNRNVETTSLRCTCTSNRCPRCNKVKRESRVIETYNKGGCPYCSSSREETITRTSSKLRATRNKTPASRQRKVYKIIEAVPVRLTEYEGEVEEIVENQPVEYYEETALRSRNYKCSKCMRESCPYCNGRYSNTRNVTTTTTYNQNYYCPRCSQATQADTTLRSRKIVTSSRREPEYLDNYKFIEVKGTSGKKRAKSQKNYY